MSSRTWPAKRRTTRARSCSPNCVASAFWRGDFFRGDAYFDAARDCQKFWEDYLLDPKNTRPAYFSTAIGKDDEAKRPEMVRAKLDSLRVLDKDGKVIGGYRVGP